MSESRTYKLSNPRFTLFASAFLLLGVGGCATSDKVPQNTRPFVFEKDTLSFANDLSWEYFYDAEGKWRNKKRQPAPEYTQHCFVVSRAARQFFLHARFDSSLPKAAAGQYEELVQTILRRSWSKPSDPTNRVVIPGYKDLRGFSRDYESLLKEESGGAWHSYFQRGHWRIMLPFSAAGQEKMAAALEAKIKNNGAPIIHLVRFPQLTINHAAVLYGVTNTPEAILFSMYDPNYPVKPATLTFDRKTRHFNLPANTYYPGGQVNVYEIYKSLVL
jgi:hypothetical protein